MKPKFPSLEIGTSDLVLDASVLINFLGTGVPDRIIESLDVPALVEDHALAEVKHHPIPHIDLGAVLGKLLSSGLLRTVRMDEVALGLFVELTSGDLAEALDDGEAATIAFAVNAGVNTIAVIDERKATKVFRSRWANHRFADTVTLLAQPKVQASIGRSDLSEACFSALVHARMRVCAEARHWIVDLIGPERASKCTSLGSS